MSTIIASNISDGTTSVASTYVVNGSAKAWVNFNGSGTVAIRDSLNVGSITDTGTGNYTVNFTAAMTDVNFVCGVFGYDTVTGPTAIKTQSYRYASAAAQPVNATNAAGTSFVDLNQIQVAVFR